MKRNKPFYIYIFLAFLSLLILAVNLTEKGIAFFVKRTILLEDIRNGTAVEELLETAMDQ